jgi:hypothetical protein
MNILSIGEFGVEINWLSKLSVLIATKGTLLFTELTDSVVKKVEAIENHNSTLKTSKTNQY